MQHKKRKGKEKMEKEVIQGLTEEDLNTKIYKMLSDSQEKGTLVKGRVIGCIPNTDATCPEQRWFATVDIAGGWKAIIPAIYMGFNVDEMVNKAGEKPTSRDKERMYHSYIRQMLTAEIDFVVINNPAAINSITKQVLGNRQIAMDKKRESNYFKSDKNGKSKIERAYEAKEPVISRVVSICRSKVLVEVYGEILPVYAKNVSWRYTENLRDIVQVGDSVHVKFNKLNIDKENKKIEAEISMKDAHANPQFENMKKFREGSELLGVITGVLPAGIGGGYFVAVGDHKNGIDVFCKKVNSIEMPRKGDTVTVKLSLFDTEKGRVFGSIEAVNGRAYAFGA